MFFKKKSIIEKFKYNEHEYIIRGYAYDDDILKRIRRHHTFYEIEILEFIKEEQIEGVYIDVGANIGNHTIFFANECPSSAVMSFECYDKTFEILQLNCDNNISPDCNVSLYNIAITGSDTVYVQPYDGENIGKTKIIYKKQNGTSGVVASSLDSCLEDVENVGLIKIDVEGNELDVLESAVNVMKKHKPAVLVEAMWNTFIDVNDLMYNSGYKLTKCFAADPNLYYYVIPSA